MQLFGAEPELMAEQAARLVASHGDDVALIDINMGCPVTKVVAQGRGQRAHAHARAGRGDRVARW